ncbi:hypothetical protein ACFUJR_01710 [Streptomyces sp. NPDC057271]|uniref:hypothetical protein n=1 Tax=unclassified Streptomyces TaxID=2593676 RepID=UPI00362D9D1C
MTITVRVWSDILATGSRLMPQITVDHCAPLDRRGFALALLPAYVEEPGATRLSAEVRDLDPPTARSDRPGPAPAAPAP